MHSVEDRLFDLASHLVYLGPHRGDPHPVYEPGREPFRRHIASRDSANPKRVNEMLERLEIPYRFQTVDLREPATLRFRPDWQLVDTRTEVEVGLDQVGYGVSQVLPIVEACLRSSDQLICIEQPELHIHPRLQAKLGNLFAATVLDGNQIIAETHSESLMLRVRKLIREGKLPSAHVAILYVDNTPGERASVRQLRLGDEGELLDPWPTGFFDDSLADILGVIE
jgi:predicted ATPase